MNINVRTSVEADKCAIWLIMEPVVRAGETYALPRDMKEEEAIAYWFSASHEVFIAEEGGEVVGTYYLRANQQGGGSHVANCGYMVAENSRGRGIARAMCVHSMERARERGFDAMQFNFVISTNERAVGLWKSLGFGVIGAIPSAFCHPRLGFVDALVMHRGII